ncbi:hypothetical protein ACF8MH_06100 [Pseudomonas sp. YQ_13]|uniref:hypothetical protein n=1 Tax=Pseudomonas sp. YQ_13 TaxID=3367235 RepID=UPI00370B27E3
MSNVEPRHEPLSINSSKVSTFLRFMSSNQRLQSVKRSDRPRPIGNCYWNVDAVVEEFGGTAVYGWDVSVWPKSHIVAMHHAVWQRPDGILEDVTDTYSSVKKRAHSTFLRDDSIEIDLRKQPNIPAKYLPFGADLETAAFIEACSQRHMVENEASRIAHKAGYRCEQQFARSRGLPIPQIRLSPAAEDAARYRWLMDRREQLGFQIGAAINDLMTTR